MRPSRTSSSLSGQARRTLACIHPPPGEVEAKEEREGLVCRKVYVVMSPKTKYTLLPLGETLIGQMTPCARGSRGACHRWRRLECSRSGRKSERLGRSDA